MKEFGKAKIYLLNQAQFGDIDMQEIEDMGAELT